MTFFPTATHHDLLVFAAQIAILLLMARLLGEVARRLKLPEVVGEILAGIILGPSLLSSLIPAAGELLVPNNEAQNFMLDTMRLVGSIILLLVTGLEIDLDLIRHEARTAAGVSIGGILLPFVAGLGLGFLLPDFLVGQETNRATFALFLATAMSISAIAVIAKILIDLDLMRRNFAQTTVAAAMIDDTIGWILMSIVVSLANQGQVSPIAILVSVGKVVAFFAFSFTLGRWLVKRVLIFVQDDMVTPERLLTLVFIFTFGGAALAMAFGLEAVIGAFIVGILLGMLPRLPEDVRRKINSLSRAFFAPLFFAIVGLKVNAISLLKPELLMMTIVVILVASLGKWLGCYVGARLMGKHDHWTASIFGAGLNARGSQEIIIATIGLSIGVLSQEMFSIIVLLAMATSLMAPALLRWLLRRVVPGEVEQARLNHEQLTSRSYIAKIHRVLLPVRYRQDDKSDPHTIYAFLLGALGADRKLSVTLLTVTDSVHKADSVQFLNRLSEMFSNAEVNIKVVTRTDTAKAILDEAQKNYDLLVLGAPEIGSSSVTMFNPIVDYLLRSSPCPTMIVKGRLPSREWTPRRILVPTNGSRAARRASELAFALSTSGRGEVHILSVVPQEENPLLNSIDVQLGVAHQVVSELQELGENLSVRTQSEVRVGHSPEEVICEVAREMADLVILGTDLRFGSRRLFLGPRVENLLSNSKRPIVILNTHPGYWQ